MAFRLLMAVVLSMTTVSLVGFEIKDEMTREEYGKSGVHRLSTSERKELNGFIEQLLQKAAPAAVADPGEEFEIDALDISKGQIVLSDGTVWKFHYSENRYLQRWAVGDTVSYHANGNNGQYRHDLKNHSVKGKHHTLEAKRIAKAGARWAFWKRIFGK